MADYLFAYKVHNFSGGRINMERDKIKNVNPQNDIVIDLLPAHAISGCDTVASYFGIGKGSVIKTLKAGYHLTSIGNVLAPFQQLSSEATNFVSACYGIPDSISMSHTRLVVWGKKNGKGHLSSPNLAALPPTTEAFLENVKRAHFQAILWRTLVHTPPELSPEAFGWKKDPCNKALIPISVPENVKVAPDYILQMIRCGCKSKSPCNSKKCSCAVNSVPCTIFCACFRLGCCRTNVV